MNESKYDIIDRLSIYMKKRFLSIGHKLMLIFTILIVITGIFIISSTMLIVKESTHQRFKVYVEDITKQTTKNIENNITQIEKLSYEILTSSIIQELLPKINSNSYSEYEYLVIHKGIRDVLESTALYDDSIEAISVISDNGIGFSAKREISVIIPQGIEKDSVYNYNGSNVWSLVNHNNNICVQRAILSFKTMEPIGYVNILVKQEFFNNIIQDISNKYKSISYIVDQDGKIMCSNDSAMVGKDFPHRLIKDSESDLFYAINSSKKIFLYQNVPMSNDWIMIITIPENELNREVAYINSTILLYCLIAIILCIVIGIIIVFRLTKPTELLLKGMHAFGNGDFTQRLSLTSNDEIGKIGQEFNNMADKIENLVEKVLRMEITQKQAEIDMLKMQINPHFLYNTLDTISWMATMNDQEEISDMAIALGNLLRATIKKDSFITVEEEIKSLSDYLFIQEYRFGDKIKVEYDIQDEALNCVIPNFILQPIIENAIYHGLEPTLEGGILKIEIKILQNMLLFRIIDNGVGMSEEEIKELYKQFRTENDNQIIGLKNVYRRIQLIYNKRSEFYVKSRKDEGTEVGFKIPLDII